MEIRHRVAFNGDTKPEFKTLLDERGIPYEVSPLPGHSVGLVSFDIVESDSNWQEVGALVRVLGASDIFNTFFSQEEILSAEWVRIIPAFEQGYPQPEDRWQVVTYRDYCPSCGIGYVQNDPFRLAKEPRLGKHDFVCLYWTYTLFATPRVLNALGEHGMHGYEVGRPVLHKTNQPSATVSQLLFPLIAQPGLAEVDRARAEVCEECGIVKYASHLRGCMHFRREALLPGTDFQLTHEWFGSGGHGGFREILASNRVAKLALDAGWRGIRLKPVILD